MPRTLEPLPLTHEPAPHRMRWVRQQCDAIRDAGILTGRYELIDGEIIRTMGQKPAHRIAVVLFYDWLASVFGARFVQSQAPIALGDADEPEPDAAVTAQPATAYREANPGADDVRLVVEVSDATLRFDRNTKAALYARAGIVEYWIADLAGRQILVHRDPTPEGYRQIVAYSESETLSTLARPGATVRVKDLLPPDGPEPVG